MSRSRSRFAAVAAVAVALLLGVAGCGPAQAPGVVPVRSMGAIGDSISRAFDACRLLADCPAASWTTGTDPTVGSFYRRLLARDPALSGRAYNVARVGATSADLQAQATALAARRPDVVTLLLGANDACAADETLMTEPSVFRARVDAALDTLYRARPDTRVFVASVPDLYRLWQVAHTSSGARLAWSFGFCRSMLDRPASTAPADEARRQRVRARVVSYNEQLAAACRSHVGCRYDGGAVFDHAFTLGDLSPFDYFHPSASGQRTLAAITWARSGL